MARVRQRDAIATSDEDLLAACVRGDQAAWDALVDRYSALIYSIPLKYGFGDADAADIFQSVCVTLVEKLVMIRAPRGLPAWIITTTSRQCIAFGRQRAREQARAIAEGPFRTDFEPTDPDLLPEDELLALERQQVVRTAMSQLPENCRQLVEALFSDTTDRSSYADIAHFLDIRMNSLGPTRARCLQKLRRLLSAAGYEHLY
jgi:RNA polymerase sigma factor (sigma-70 family)